METDLGQESSEDVKHTLPRIWLIIGTVFGFLLFGTGGFYLGSINSLSKSQTDKETAPITRISPTQMTEKSDSLCGIEKIRLSQPVIYGDTKYYVYTRNSMNVIIPSVNKNYLQSGVFAIQNGDTSKCQKLIEVLDESPAKNNIYEIYSYHNSLYVMAVDQIGGGSGEGNAKILKSDDNGKTWEVKYCFYYTPEAKITIKDFVTNTQNKVKNIGLDNPYCKNFILGVEGGSLK